MSPYLFNICLEALSKSIMTRCDMKEWTPFTIGSMKVHISHLLFVDDILLFSRVDEDKAFAVRQTLDFFCKVSGQKVNELKSKLIFSPNMNSYHKNLFQQTINVEVRSQIQFVVDKMRHKLAMWKTKFLITKAGRLCLIKSTLSTISV